MSEVFANIGRAVLVVNSASWFLWAFFEVGWLNYSLERGTFLYAMAGAFLLASLAFRKGSA